MLWAPPIHVTYCTIKRHKLDKLRRQATVNHMCSRVFNDASCSLREEKADVLYRDDLREVTRRKDKTIPRSPPETAAFVP